MLIFSQIALEILWIVYIIHERFVNTTDKEQVQLYSYFSFSLLDNITLSPLHWKFLGDNYTNQWEPFWNGRRIPSYWQWSLNGMLPRRSFHKLQLSVQSSVHSIFQKYSSDHYQSSQSHNYIEENINWRFFAQKNVLSLVESTRL